MKRIFIAAFVAISFFANAQEELEKKVDANAVDAEVGYQFTTVVDVEATSVKNQSRSSTCWSFAGISFLESEMIRNGSERIDLSEMYVVRMSWLDKARKYVRMHGKTNFSAGGEAPDILYVLEKYGAMPNDAYSGLANADDNHNHKDLDKVLTEFVTTLPQGKNINPNWEKAFNALLDLYLGELPTEFEYNGKKYTPRTFADKVVKLNAKDYVNITSFTHHPFYSSFILEIPDNWMWASFYNLPINEMMGTIDNALENGYSVAWATDISEKGFSRKNGIAILPEKPWNDISDEEKLALFSGPHKETMVSQEMRQVAFDNYETQDDHGMHFTGIAKDQDGNKFYIVKNSWGERESPYRTGYVFASEAFVSYKTISILVHKDALTKKVKKELSL